jgi:hypothetical protein
MPLRALAHARYSDSLVMRKFIVTPLAAPTLLMRISCGVEAVDAPSVHSVASTSQRPPPPPRLERTRMAASNDRAVKEAMGVHGASPINSEAT